MDKFIPNFFYRIYTTKIYPKFLSSVKQLLTTIYEKENLLFIAISGYRSIEEQQELYNQGRITDGKIVTNAKPYESFHNYGLAVDVCLDANPDKKGLQPIWNNPIVYKLLADKASEFGIKSGFYFKFFDPYHLELDIFKFGLNIKQLKELLINSNNSLVDFWTKLDEYFNKGGK